MRYSRISNRTLIYWHSLMV